MEQAVMEQRPAERNNFNILRIIQPVSYTDIYSIPWITRQNEVEAWEDSQTSLGGIWTSQFCALHSYQSKDGAKKTQADGRDHEATAHLNISYTTENEKSNSGLPKMEEYLSAEFYN